MNRSPINSAFQLVELVQTFNRIGSVDFEFNPYPAEHDNPTFANSIDPDEVAI